MQTHTNSSVTLNPIQSFADEPDACMKMLIQGAGLSYLAPELFVLPGEWDILITLELALTIEVAEC